MSTLRLLVPWLILFAAGCSGAAIRSQSPEQADAQLNDVRLVGDLAVPVGMHPVRVESIGLVLNLPGTGSDPPPSYERSAVTEEMKVRGVDSPNKLLASNNASVVLVSGYLRPGIQKGDHFDVEIRTPTRSETTSLRGGWLMECRLKEMANVGNQMHEGAVFALCQGSVLVDPSAQQGDDNAKIALTRGRILGGGTATKSRPLGLALKPDRRSVPNASRVGAAINQRFHTFSQGEKRGVATPRNDEYIELLLHPRYKHNLPRYVQVVRSIPLREPPTQRISRLTLLERQLLDPVTAESAALKLEAIGNEAIEVLKKGIASSDPLVSFYSAEALAYLDDASAAEPLEHAARDHRAFRIFALTALSAMSDYSAFESLSHLLSVSSAETRYGAFRALWAMNPKDPLIRGEEMRGKFSYHVLDVAGPEMIHLTHSLRPEVVLWGKDQVIKTPLLIEAGRNLLIKAGESNEVTVSRFAVNEPNQERVVSNKLDDVIRAVVELGGTYPDVVQILQKAKQDGILSGRLEVDAVPEAGRMYYADNKSGAGGSSEELKVDAGHPLPDLFRKASSERPSRSAKKSKPDSSDDPEGDAESAKPTEQKRGPIRRALGKIT